MMSKRKVQLISFITVLVLAALACGGGSTVSPTALPAPTNVPAEATAVPPDPTAEPTVAPTTIPATVTTGETVDLEILMLNDFIDNFDSLNVVGLVRNNTDRIVDNIEVEVEIFDANNVSVWVETTYADLYNVVPGGVTPFSLTIYDDLANVDNYVATVVGNSTTEFEPAALDFLNVIMVHDDNGDTHIIGELINNTGQPVELNSLAAATYDATGLIQTANYYSTAIRYLDPGASGPFRVTITGQEAGIVNIADFEVYVDAQVTDAIAPFNITISDAYNYKDVFDYPHLVGEVTNNDSVNLNISLIAAIYNANNEVIDVASVTLPISSLAPGETLPFDFDFWGPLNYLTGYNDEADSYSIEVDAYRTRETDTVLLDLTTQNDTNEFDSFSGVFTGQVVNATGGPVDNVTIVVYFRDVQTGEVIAVAYDYIFDPIADGGTADYDVYVDIPEGFDISSAEYIIIVKGERAQ